MPGHVEGEGVEGEDDYMNDSNPDQAPAYRPVAHAPLEERHRFPLLGLWLGRTRTLRADAVVRGTCPHEGLARRVSRRLSSSTGPG
jgi:hypothetical protein